MQSGLMHMALSLMLAECSGFELNLISGSFCTTLIKVFKINIDRNKGTVSGLIHHYSQAC